jgi:hypothetical protein
LTLVVVEPRQIVEVFPLFRKVDNFSFLQVIIQ